MADLSDALRDDSQAAVAILTTEHFNLQTERGATIFEANGRATLFLGAVSAAMVAIAFAGQTSRTALYTFGLVLFPVLTFLGLMTFERTLQASIEDTHVLVRINRIRRFYLEATPRLAPYLARPAAGDDVAGVLHTEGYAHRWQLILTIVGAVGVINSVLVGVTVGLAVAALTGDDLRAATAVGLPVFAISVAAHERYQKAQRQRSHRLDDLFGVTPDVRRPGGSDASRAGRQRPRAFTGDSPADRLEDGSHMEQRLSVITLGVADIPRAQDFYEKLGWHVDVSIDDDNDHIVFFQAPGMILSVWDRAKLADDGGIVDPGGWGGVTIGHCVDSSEDVERILAAAQDAGATISSPGREREWGGYSGIFRDLDGHSWEIEHNPSWTIRGDGSTTLGA